MKKHGFTIVEILIASLISVLVIGGVTTSLAHILRTWRETQVAAELNTNLELAMEHMRQDLRLSSVGIGLMSFYPAGSERYTAISFPLAEDTDGDGMLDRDAEGRIMWSRTAIYHVLGSTPNEFRRTVFQNRSPTASPSALYGQLTAVAKATTEEGIAAAALPGETCNSRAVFRNLTHLAFYPPSALFDGYAETRERGSTFNFGSLVLAPGDHKLTFRVKNKNTESSGYNVEIDRFRLGRARGPVEGEVFFPKNTHPRSPMFSYAVSGGSANAEDMTAYGVEWSGGAQAKFDAGGVGSEITFTVSNDMWCDSNFNEPGAQISSNCSVKWDTSFELIAPFIGDMVVSMDKGIAWSAAACGDAPYVLPITSATSVSTIMYGSQARDDMAILLNGRWAKLRFERPDGHSLNLSDVRITDLTSGGSSAVTFNGGAAMVTVPSDGPSLIESDWIEMWETVREHTYAVSFTSTPQGSGSWGLSGWWNNDGVVLSSVNGTPSQFTAGLHSFDVGYPDEAIYRSGVFDTHCEDPRYTYFYWTQIEKFSEGGDIDVRIRSGSSPDMADGNWLEAYPSYDGYFQSNGRNLIGGMPARRYVQYEAKFQCGHGGRTDAHTNSPTAILRDVSVLWSPPMGLVDLEVDFGMGPDCGIVEATVDGKTFARSMIVELAIFKEGPRGTQTAEAKTEIRPLNTGK